MDIVEILRPLLNLNPYKLSGKYMGELLDEAAQQIKTHYSFIKVSEMPEELEEGDYLMYHEDGYHNPWLGVLYVDPDEEYNLLGTEISYFPISRLGDVE